MQITLIAAMDRNRVIGRDNTMPWHLPADLAHFKASTLGKPILMGRKTFDSLGRPLPGRHNIVLTRDLCWHADGVSVAHDLDQSVEIAGEQPELMIIGGATVYESLLTYADRLCLTFIDAEFQGDAWFPKWDPSEWKETSRMQHSVDSNNPHSYSIVTLERIRGDG